ncbi:hypothetical protein B0O80DRAFT_426317 [Mortierella sp. GBAus27b]|nr:hypothetical protein B0O80DRAFT_426317 [Mortierella sp. GBAus27b]
MTIGDVQETELTFQPSDFSFLSQLLHILQKVETGEDPQEIATLAANLKASFKKCQTILDHLPGADLSPDEQERILEEEMKVLEKKKIQLSNYLAWQVFQNGSERDFIKQEHSSDVHVSHPLTSEPEDTSRSVSESTEASTSAPVAPQSSEDVGIYPSGQLDEVMVDDSDAEIKNEYKESMPSLITDGSSLSESSQSFTSSSQPTGLSFAFADVKMDEEEDH